jgi:hypothetical protein
MNLIDRVKNIIANPNKEWNVIATEPADAGKIVMGYVLPLTALAAILCSYCIYRRNCFCVFNCSYY